MKVFLIEANWVHEGSYIVSAHASMESASKAKKKIEASHERYEKREAKADADGTDFDYNWPPHYRYDLSILEFKVKP